MVRIWHTKPHKGVALKEQNDADLTKIQITMSFL
jgi:hypothetical protein